MQTQPEQAVGGATNDDTVIAAEPTIEDRFAALTDEQADDPAPAEPSDEDKAAFSELPRALQERVTTREAEREKFVQAKSREAAQSAQTARNQAFEQVQQVKQAQIQQLAALLPEVPQEPSAHLLVQDPAGYAAAKDHVDQVRAYRDALVQQIDAIANEQNQTEAQFNAARQQASYELLKQHLPEVFEEKGPELVKQIESTALALGYSQDQIVAADGGDILALNTAMGWKAKADKYDALMSKQMEKVRSAKELPRVSRPGSATTKGAVANQRYTADREAMRRGDKDAAARAIARFL